MPLPNVMPPPPARPSENAGGSRSPTGGPGGVLRRALCDRLGWVVLIFVGAAVGGLVGVGLFLVPETRPALAFLPAWLGGAMLTTAGWVSVWSVCGRRKRRSLRDLAAAVDAAAAGNPGPALPGDGQDEMGALAGAVNRLSRALQEARAARDGDESRLRRAHEVVQRSQDFLNNLVESLPQFIDQKDKAGRYTFVTEYVCRAVGRDREDVLGQTDRDLFAPAVAQQRVIRHERVLAERKPQEAVEHLELADGTARWLKTITMPLFDENGGLLGTQSVSWDVSELKRAEEALVQAHENLVKASRMAGMAEIATGILHNVGNVLNSVNVSTTLIHDRVKKSRVSNLARVAALFEEHQRDLANYLTNDPKGCQLPGYVASLARHLEAEKSELLGEIKGLTDSVDHVKQIVAMQQAHAKAGGVLELLALPELVEDALRLNGTRLIRAGIEVVRRFDEVPRVLVDRHRTLQILVNLITNATHAIQEAGRTDGRVVVGLAWNGPSRVRLIVEDNGKGIAPDHLAKIFQHGFTTRKDGHGFGLHSGALAAKEMGGALIVASPGPNQGATFALELPIAATEARSAA